MTDYVDVAVALVSAGYLTEADIEAATEVLADALLVEIVEDVEGDAMDDYSEQEDLIAKAQVRESENLAKGDVVSAVVDDEIIADAEVQKEFDKETVRDAETVIDAAYIDAATALVAAELIDEANLSLAAAVIAGLWVVEDDLD
jgi:hypothetical protein